MNAIKDSLISTLKKTLSFKGRATRLDFWTFVVFWVLVNIVLFVFTALLSLIRIGVVGLALSGIINLAFFVCYISVSVRRLHDLGLSGFWIWYLQPAGLAIIYVVYLLGLDSASERVIGKIQNVGSAWLGWILTFLFWPAGSAAALFLMFLYAGKKEDNEFGPNPYID